MESFPLWSYYWTFVFFVILFASIIQGMTGFGAGLLAGPTLVLFLEPKLVVIILMFTGIANLLFVVYYARRHIYAARALPLIVPAMLGVPLGTYILYKVASSGTSLAIALISIIFSILLLMGYHMPIKREAMASLGVGFASGVMCAAVGMGGPPLILFLSNQKWPKEIFRGTIAVLFLLTGTLSIILYVLAGIATNSRVIESLSLVPAGIIGFYIGNVIFNRVSSFLFMKISLSLIFITGLISLFINLCRIL
ncbi:MAG: uncharacterized protein QG552_1779 [Thermodesulfobacteriota bacterium]|nr:uncharacterized protein [Thermodesulfobacteriota bacterium]